LRYFNVFNAENLSGYNNNTSNRLGGFVVVQEFQWYDGNKRAGQRQDMLVGSQLILARPPLDAQIK
jgi:hypothetical protein